MRRLLAFVFVFVVTGLLFGCGEGTKPPPQQKGPVKAQEGEEAPAKKESNF